MTDDLLKKLEELAAQKKALEEENVKLKSAHPPEEPKSSNKLSFISDFIDAIYDTLSDSHGKLSINFGGGLKGAIWASIFMMIFTIGLSTIAYIAYETINSKEQTIFLPDEK